MLEVGAALIWQKDRFLVCQRPETKSCPLLWEFPGGKVEPGETGEAALARECLEELGCKLQVGPPMGEVIHRYPDFVIHLTLFHCFLQDELPVPLEHHDLRWLRESELEAYDFCPADRALISQNVGRFLRPAP